LPTRRPSDLAPEPGVETLVPGQIGAEHLDGNCPVETVVATDVDLCHAATPDQLADLVATGQHPGNVVDHLAFLHFLARARSGPIGRWRWENQCGTGCPRCVRSAQPS